MQLFQPQKTTTRAGKHAFSWGKCCSQRIFQNFVTEKSSAFDLPPMLFFASAQIALRAECIAK
jgi:hypothetical protein